MKYLLFLVLNMTVWSAYALETKNCNPEEAATVNLAHETAKSYILKAHEILETNNSILIEDGLKKYFNIDIHSDTEKSHIAFVKESMKRLWKNVDRVKYKCAKDSGLYCSPGILALVPPLSRIQICPSYFSRSFEKQVGTLIHEWGHRWGFFRLKYIFEKYCTETAGADASVLIKQPDSYMLFTYYLATNGIGVECFKLKEH